MMKGGMILAVGTLGLMLTAGGETGVDFRGVWIDQSGDDVWRLDLADGRKGQMTVRGWICPLTWSDGGSEGVRLSWRYDNGKEERATLTYNPERDLLSFGLPSGRTTPLGFSGSFLRVESRSERMKGPAVVSLSGCGVEEPVDPGQLPAQEEKLLEIPLSEIAYGEIGGSRHIVRTVDGLYPRVVMMADPWNPKGLRIYYIYGRQRTMSADRRKASGKIAALPYPTADIVEKELGRAVVSAATKILDDGIAQVVPFELVCEEKKELEAGVLLLLAPGHETEAKEALGKLSGQAFEERRKVVKTPSASCDAYEAERGRAAEELGKAMSLLKSRIQRGDPPRQQPRAANARSLAEARRVMRENDYEGEWEEEHDGEVVRMSLLKDFTGLYQYRETSVPIRWTSNGKGRIDLVSERFGRKEKMPSVKYIPETDALDLGFNGRKTALGFTGILSFATKTVGKARRSKIVFDDEYVDDSNLHAQFDTMMKEKDPCLLRLDSPKDFPSVEEILKRNICVEIVDKEYPRIKAGGFLNEFGIVDIDVTVSRYDSKSVTDENRVWRRYFHPESHDLKRLTGGLEEREVARFMKNAEERGVANWKVRSLYGKGKEYWYEEIVGMTFVPRERKLSQEILDELLSTLSYPRYCTVKPAKKPGAEGK